MKINFVYKRIIFGALFLAISVSAFAYLFITIRNRNAEASVLATEIQEQTIREIKLKSLKRTVTGTDEIRQSLDRYFIQKDRTVSFIEEIERLGLEEGVSLQISDVRVEAYPQREEFEWLVVSLSASGDWASVLNTEARLESLPYKSEINNIFLTRGDGENQDIWTLRLVVKVLMNK
jgi:Tfp pilus assembly protein PilO